MNDLPNKNIKKHSSPWIVVIVPSFFIVIADSTFYGIYEQLTDENGTVIGILKGVLDATDVRKIGEESGDL